MIKRKRYLAQIESAIQRSPVTSLLGPRQCGKTTLAREIAKMHESTYLDLENPTDKRRLENPMMLFDSLKGLVIIDEIQSMPELFAILRVVVDKPDNKCNFLILGSASPDIIKGVSETLAGRIAFVDMAGFDFSEVGIEHTQSLWVRGGFPRSFLADSDKDSAIWREDFIRTFLQRDIPQAGINIPAETMRRFWTMLAHFHGQNWNASKISSAMGVDEKSMRYYLDVLTETYMIRQLLPWFENIKKRQVKAPKIYFRDSGLLHSLLGLSDYHSLLGHPQVGASWEGFALEQVLSNVNVPQAYYWATYSNAELDLFFELNGKRIGLEFKLSEAPSKTRSMTSAIDTLNLDILYIVYPGDEVWPVNDKVTVCSLAKVVDLICSDNK